MGCHIFGSEESPRFSISKGPTIKYLIRNNAAFIDIKVLIIFVDSWGLKENPPCSDWN